MLKVAGFGHEGLGAVDVGRRDFQFRSAVHRHAESRWRNIRAKFVAHIRPRVGWLLRLMGVAIWLSSYYIIVHSWNVETGAAD